MRGPPPGAMLRSVRFERDMYTRVELYVPGRGWLEVAVLSDVFLVSAGPIEAEVDWDALHEAHPELWPQGQLVVSEDRAPKWLRVWLIEAGG